LPPSNDPQPVNPTNIAAATAVAAAATTASPPAALPTTTPAEMADDDDDDNDEYEDCRQEDEVVEEQEEEEAVKRGEVLSRSEEVSIRVLEESCLVPFLEEKLSNESLLDMEVSGWTLV
jgi:hypothetical protein